MPSLEAQILNALLDLEATAGAPRLAGEKKDLLGIFKKIDELTEQLPPETSSELLHFLHKKSYQKARLWLEGRQGENARGSCGR